MDLIATMLTRSIAAGSQTGLFGTAQSGVTPVARAVAAAESVA